jgi:hypothetical protein
VFDLLVDIVGAGSALLAPLAEELFVFLANQEGVFLLTGALTELLTGVLTGELTGDKLGAFDASPGDGGIGGEAPLVEPVVGV